MFLNLDLNKIYIILYSISAFRRIRFLQSLNKRQEQMNRFVMYVVYRMKRNGLKPLKMLLTNAQ